MAKRIAKITYETEACSRCGGGGRYSFNLVDGDKCYGCGGTGQTYTRNGRRANLAVKKFILEQFGRRADEVELGQRVRLAGDRGYHYFGSGRTFFLMGDAFGRAMIDLTAK